MTRSERYHVPGRVHATAIIWIATLRAGAREPIFWLELLLLGILTVFAALSTPGSPNAADSALHLTAVVYTVVPFSLVPVIGQLMADPGREAAWWSRPVTRDDYYWGRFLGVVSLGLISEGVLAALGGMVSAAATHVPFVGSVLWNLGLTGGLATANVFLVAGFFLWLAQVTGGGRRYHLAAVVLSLGVGFAEFQFPVLAAMWPRLVFFNPFPGFLAFGLTMPSPWLGAFPLPGWLIANRVGFAVLGAVWVMAAVQPERGYARHYLSPTGLSRVVGSALLVLELSGGIFVYAPWVNALAPRSTSLPVQTASFLFTRPARLMVHLDAASGLITGREVLPVPSYATPPAGLRLNGGLRIDSVRFAGKPVLLSPIAKGAVISTTSTRMVRLRLAANPHGGALIIQFSGHLWPYPSPLPYRPFQERKIYEPMAVGAQRVFLNGVGDWFPEPLLRRTHAPGWLIAGVRGPLIISVDGLSAADHIFTNLRPRARKTWTGSLTNPCFLAAPYHPQTVGRLRVFTAQPLTLAQRSALAVYGRAWRSLAPAWFWRPPSLTAVESPVAREPRLQAALLIFSGFHPDRKPVDLIADRMSPPTLALARGWLADWWWQERLGQLGRQPWQARGLTPSRLAPALAVLTLLKTAPANQAARLLDATSHRRPIPGLGTLTPGQRNLVAELAPRLRHVSRSAWLHAISGLDWETWRKLNNQAEFIHWWQSEVARP